MHVAAWSHHRRLRCHHRRCPICHPRCDCRPSWSPFRCWDHRCRCHRRTYRPDPCHSDPELQLPKEQKETSVSSFFRLLHKVINHRERQRERDRDNTTVSVLSDRFVNGNQSQSLCTHHCELIGIFRGTCVRSGSGRKFWN